MSKLCPRLVIAAPASGEGKTSLSLGLTAALARRGLRVQTFKVGPDFLDPSYLARASGRLCYNLDGWMTGREYVADVFARATAQADIAIIEGVMGLFDGASASSLEGSTAEIAAWLGAPVLLVVNVHGAARSLAATVKGFAEFEPAVRVTGVIANHCGGERHRALLEEALRAAQLPPLVGAVPRDALPVLPSRHLGLVTADRQNCSGEVIEGLGQACERYLDVERIVELARAAGTPAWEGEAPAEPLGFRGEFEQRGKNVVGQRTARQERVPAGISGGSPTRPPKEPRPAMTRASGHSSCRLGIAEDEAFHFYYPDNLQMLEAAGATLVPFSPLKDAGLPPELDGLYVGGGYPEVHAARLSGNGSMLEAICHFAASGRPVYAECGGLMYLGRSVQTVEGERVPLAGVLPIDTVMLGRLQSLGYVEVTLSGDSLWGPMGQVLRGHEFHYSKIVADDSAAAGWQSVYRVRRRRAGAEQAEGWQKGRILASYVHLHFASCPLAVTHFLQTCKGRL